MSSHVNRQRAWLIIGCLHIDASGGSTPWPSFHYTLPRYEKDDTLCHCNIKAVPAYNCYVLVQKFQEKFSYKVWTLFNSWLMYTISQILYSQKNLLAFLEVRKASQLGGMLTILARHLRTNSQGCWHWYGVSLSKSNLVRGVEVITSAGELLLPNPKWTLVKADNHASRSIISPDKECTVYSLGVYTHPLH